MIGAKERRIWLMNYREFREAIEDTDTVILPIGVCEAHGPHLPLGTDFIIPEWLSLRIAERVNALIAPPIYYGVAIGLSGYLGTLTIRESTLESLVYDVLSELSSNGFEKVLIMNGHGGSAQTVSISNAMRRAWQDFRIKSAMIMWWDLAKDLTEQVFGGSGGHAGVDEAALVMAVDRSLVRGGIEEEEIYSLRSGLQVVPIPGSMIAYDSKFLKELPDEVRVAEFAEKLIERIVSEVTKLLEGWERQEVVF